MLTRFTQIEYSKLLDDHQARKNGLSQTDCEIILEQHGASPEQAKNGAYVYLHHGDHIVTTRRGSREVYERLLNAFGASEKEPKDCIRHLEEMGFAYRQSQTAVYQYRKRNGLIGK